MNEDFTMFKREKIRKWAGGKEIENMGIENKRYTDIYQKICIWFSTCLKERKILKPHQRIMFIPSPCLNEDVHNHVSFFARCFMMDFGLFVALWLKLFMKRVVLNSLSREGGFYKLVVSSLMSVRDFFIYIFYVLTCCSQTRYTLLLLKWSCQTNPQLSG